MTPCDRGGRRECSSLPLFCWISVVEGGFENWFFRNRARPSVRPFARACVRASGQKPIAGASVDFVSPKVMGSNRGTFLYGNGFCRQLSRSCFAKRCGDKKIATSCQSVFFCGIHNSHIFFFIAPTGANKYYYTTCIPGSFHQEDRRVDSPWSQATTSK